MTVQGLNLIKRCQMAQKLITALQCRLQMMVQNCILWGNLPSACQNPQRKPREGLHCARFLFYNWRQFLVLRDSDMSLQFKWLQGSLCFELDAAQQLFMTKSLLFLQTSLKPSAPSVSHLPQQGWNGATS